MATPTQTTAVVRADNVGANPSIAAGLTFQAGRDVIVHLTGYTPNGAVTGVAIGGTAGSLIARSEYDPGNGSFTYAESWLIDGVGSNSSNINVSTPAGSGNYITCVAREFAAGTFGAIDGSADGGTFGSAQNMTITGAAAVAGTPNALVATFTSYEIQNPVGWTDITGYSDVVEYEDNANSQAILCGWLEDATSGTKSVTGTQASNFRWVGSLGVVRLGGGGGGLVVNPLTGRGGAAARPLAA